MVALVMMDLVSSSVVGWNLTLLSRRHMTSMSVAVVLELGLFSRANTACQYHNVTKVRVGGEGYRSRFSV